MTERTLHPHQAAILRELSNVLRAGCRRPVIAAPTGFGKTEVMATIAKAYRGKERSVLVVVPRISLLEQTADRFRQHGLDHVGIIQAQHPRSEPGALIQIASAQTLAARGLNRVPDADVVLVDECHILFKFTRDWLNEPRWRRVPFIGFSATPGTAGLGLYYDILVPAATTQDLIEAGYLSPLRAFAPASGLLPDLKGIKTANTEAGRDFATGELSKRMQAPKLIADVVLVARGSQHLR